MRLTSTIIAVFLALSMAIFPVTMVLAAATSGHGHAAMAQSEHGDHHHHLAFSPEADSSSYAGVDGDCAPVGNASHKSGPSCCGMGACHVFQMSAVPCVSTPAGAAHVMHAPGDQQVTGAFSVRIDRPPRTV